MRAASVTLKSSGVTVIRPARLVGYTAFMPANFPPDKPQLAQINGHPYIDLISLATGSAGSARTASASATTCSTTHSPDRQPRTLGARARRLRARRPPERPELQPLPAQGVSGAHGATARRHRERLPLLAPRRSDPLNTMTAAPFVVRIDGPYDDPYRGLATAGPGSPSASYIALVSIAWQAWSFTRSGSRVTATIGQGLMGRGQAITIPRNAAPGQVAQMRSRDSRTRSTSSPRAIAGAGRPRSCRSSCSCRGRVHRRNHASAAVAIPACRAERATWHFDARLVDGYMRTFGDALPGDKPRVARGRVPAGRPE